jgi:hypothetical protein
VARDQILLQLFEERVGNPRLGWLERHGSEAIITGENQGDKESSESPTEHYPSWQRIKQGTKKELFVALGFRGRDNYLRIVRF